MSGGRANRGSFKPGQSGNPGGRPSTAEISALARRYTPDALRALVDVARAPRVSKNLTAIATTGRALIDIGYPGLSKGPQDAPQSVTRRNA
jgi:hypothetical protein